MKPKYKKIIVVVCSCLVLIGVSVGIILGVNARALSGCKLELSQDKSYYAVVGVRDKSAQEISIPESYRGKPVKVIAEGAFHRCERLKSVVIPNGITTIGTAAFSWCASLENVEIPNSVTAIELGAFAWCSRLTSVKLSENLKQLGEYAFSGCGSLESVTIPKNIESIGAGAFNYCAGLKSLVFEDVNNWYATESLEDWQSKTGGALMDFSSAVKNASLFISTHVKNYWYKA